MIATRTATITESGTELAAGTRVKSSVKATSTAIQSATDFQNILATPLLGCYRFRSGVRNGWKLTLRAHGESDQKRGEAKDGQAAIRERPKPKPRKVIFATCEVIERQHFAGAKAVSGDAAKQQRGNQERKLDVTHLANLARAPVSAMGGKLSLALVPEHDRTS
jgi:hypothetical protein